MSMQQLVTERQALRSKEFNELADKLDRLQPKYSTAWSEIAGASFDELKGGYYCSGLYYLWRPILVSPMALQFPYCRWSSQWEVDL